MGLARENIEGVFGMNLSYDSVLLHIRGFSIWGTKIEKLVYQGIFSAANTKLITRQLCTLRDLHHPKATSNPGLS